VTRSRAMSMDTLAIFAPEPPRLLAIPVFFNLAKDYGRAILGKTSQVHMVF
jgi:hypothetical protein